VAKVAKVSTTWYGMGAVRADGENSGALDNRIWYPFTVLHRLG
jgi:hypothetical protein